MFSDASSGVGLGITIGNHWHAWRLLPGWHTRDSQKDIGWAKAVAFELLMHAITVMVKSDGRVVVHGDNTGIVEGWKNGHHHNQASSSDESTLFFTPFLPTSISIPDMYKANSTPQMVPHVVSLAQWTPSFLPSLSLLSSSLSSLTLSNPPLHLNSSLSSLVSIPLPPPRSSTMLSSVPKSMSALAGSEERNSTSFQMSSLHPNTAMNSNSRFNTPIHPIDNAPTRPLPYHADLAPSPSPLRPHCLTKDCLWLWCPAPNPVVTAMPPVALEIQLNCILQVMNASLQDSTKDGAGLLVFHVFCNQQGIPEASHCPAMAQLILTFLSCCAGAYASFTLSNYAAGLRAWHDLHSQPWLVDPDALKHCLDGASKLAPSSSKHPLCPPFTTEIISSIKQLLSPDEPLDAAIFACFTTCFWCIARLGEFTIPNLKAFDASKHVTRKHVSSVTDCNGLNVIKIDLPWTKMSSSTGCRESVQCARQDGPSDLVAALNVHFRMNPAPPGSHLFAWKFKDGSFRPLTHKQFLSRVADLTSHMGLANIKGHSLRIGGTLEYLLQGVPFNTVQSQGRWAGKAFSLYMRKHAMILAPYLQASPGDEPFMRYFLPPVH